MSLPSFTPGAMAAALLVCSLASAQSEDQLPGFELERLDTNVGRGSLLMGNGELMVPGGLTVNLLGHYQRMPLVLNDGERDLGVVSDRATSVLSASYGVFPWLELSAQLPFVIWQQGADPATVGLAPLSAQGLGTPVLQARLGLLSRRQRQPVDLSADLGVGLPVGSGLALAGDTGPRFHARMVVGTTIGWLQPSIEAGVLFRPSILLAADQDADVKTGATSEVRLGAALATTGKGLRGELGLRASVSPRVSMELLGGVRFPLLVGLDAFVLGGPGLGRAPGTPLFRMVAGVSFRSEPPPKISYLNAREDDELQLTLATPTAPEQEERVRSAGTWELNALGRGENRVAEDAQPREVPRPYQLNAQEKLVLRGEVLFEQGSAQLSGVVPLLDQAVLRLSEQAQAGTILIEGHEDTGDGDTLISLRRAQAVRRYLIDQGIPGTQIKIRGFGSHWPVSAQPATPQERQLNRRAEVLVISNLETVTTQAPVP